MSDLLQDRYGTGHPRRRVVVIVATTVLGAVFLTWLIWAAYKHADTPLDAEVASYRVVSAHEIDVKLQIRVKKGQTTGSCTFGATASDHTPVGDRTLTVKQLQDAGNSWVPISTLSLATTVDKVSCTPN